MLRSRFSRRWVLIATVAAALISYSGSVSTGDARGAIPSEDRWDPRHIGGLPPEIRGAVSRHERACGGPLAAEHAFSRYIQAGSPRYSFIALHFEHLRCGDRAALCTKQGCIHEIFASSGGRYRRVLSVYASEIELKILNGTPAVDLTCEGSTPACPRILYWNGTQFSQPRAPMRLLPM
jgi:hypothetical protein